MDFNAHRHQPTGATSHPHGFRRRHQAMALKLLALPVALLLVAPVAALAATTTGYNQTPTPPTSTGYKQTPSTPKTTPTSGTTPAKGEVAPKEEREAASKEPAHEVAPTSTTMARARSGRLPFTGLDLRWLIVGGVLLVGVGVSILVAQRGRHDHGG